MAVILPETKNTNIFALKYLKNYTMLPELPSLDGMKVMDVVPFYATLIKEIPNGSDPIFGKFNHEIIAKWSTSALLRIKTAAWKLVENGGPFPPLFVRDVTGRGFAILQFNDSNGIPCSVQKSSSAMEDKIWLGANKIGLKKFVEGGGWEDVPLESDSHIANNRMHLTRDQVAELIPILQQFVKTGNL